MLLDTCVIIDYLRQKPEAVEFLEGMEAVPAITTATVAELFSGVRGTRERELLYTLVEAFEIYDIDVATAEKSGELLQQYQPAHGLDLIDAMIAATATLNSLELATLNLKHFPMFPDLKKPY